MKLHIKIKHSTLINNISWIRSNQDEWRETAIYRPCVTVGSKDNLFIKCTHRPSELISEFHQAWYSTQPCICIASQTSHNESCYVL